MIINIDKSFYFVNELSTVNEISPNMAHFVKSLEAKANYRVVSRQMLILLCFDVWHHITNSVMLDINYVINF